MSHKHNQLIFGIMVLLVMLLSACGQKEPVDLINQPGPAITAPAMGVMITADNCPSIVIQKGFQVTWLNSDKSEHFVQFMKTEGQEQDFLVDSGVLQPGDRFAFTFDIPGTYTYRCSAMDTTTGMVTVTE